MLQPSLIKFPTEKPPKIQFCGGAGEAVTSCHFSSGFTERPCLGTGLLREPCRPRWGGVPAGLEAWNPETTSSCSSVFFLKASSKRRALSRRDWLWKVSVSTWSCK